MAALSSQDARAIMEKALHFSKAEACEVNINANAGGNIRFARNTVNTAGATQDTQLVVQSFFGQRAGTVTLNEFDDTAIERAVRRSEELAHLAPEDAELVHPLGPQQYVDCNAFFDNVATITPDYRTQVAANSITPAKAQDCTAAGFLQDGSQWQAMQNTAGLFAYSRQTGASFSLTARTNDGTGSGYVTRECNDLSKFDIESASRIAIAKATASRNAKAIEPGKYTVILEPEAGINLLANLIFNLDARAADEGRSFLAKPGGGTKKGEKLVDERVHVWSDPAHPDVPTAPWQGDGRPYEKTDWVAAGAVQNTYVSRYWAQKQGIKAIPFPPNLIMDGGTASTEDLIRDTTRGVLVTRTWYIRSVDPQTVLVTGLTRDGTFYIENGQIKYAIKNFRFNESPIIMLNNLDAIGKQQRVSGSDAGITTLMPVLRIRDFNFSSLSDAV